MPSTIQKAERKKEAGKDYLFSEAQKTLDNAGKEGWELKVYQRILVVVVGDK